MSKIRPFRRCFAPVAIACASISAVALAQTVPTPIENPYDPRVILANNLKILSRNPRNVDALLAAGKGSLESGDANAAVGFLARAEELAPTNWMVKLALGSALTQVEQPDEALQRFSEAKALGVQDYQMAGDRGLAWDLKGEPVFAQRDYDYAMKYARSDELVRRYALSLGISGAKDKAIKLLDPLTQRSDQAAWRAKAFVLAMNGDLAGADRIVRAVMPPSMAAYMTPFLRRLSGLTFSQRAQAVNFGTMPANGPQFAAVDPGEFRSVGNGNAAGLNGRQPSSALATNLAKPIFKESANDRKKREREEKELAKLAEKGRKAAGLPAVQPAPAPVAVAQPKPPIVQPTPLPQPVRVAVATPPKPPTAAPLPKPFVPPSAPPPSPLTSRVGPKVADVDPAKLPPEVRAIERPTPTDTAPKVVRVTGTNILPPPDGVRPPVSVMGPASPLPPVQKPVVAVATPTPTLPKPFVPPQPDPVKPALAQPTPAPTPPISAPPLAPTPSQVAPISTPAPKLVEIVAPKPTPPVPASAVITPRPQPPLMGPPAPTPTPNISVPPAPKPAEIVPPKIAVSTDPANTVVTSKSAVPTPVDIVPQKPVIGGSTPAIPAPASDPSPGFSVPAAPPKVEPAIAVKAPEPSSQPLVTPPSSGTTSDPALVGPPKPDPAIVTVTQPPSSEAVRIITPATQSDPNVKIITPPPPSPPPAPAVTVVEPTPSPEPAPKSLEATIQGLDLEEQAQAGPILSENQLRAKQRALKQKEVAEAKAAAEKEAEEKAAAKEKAKAKAEEKKKADAEAKIKEEERKREAASPSRIWVQVATGANRSGLPITWKKLKGDAPEVLKASNAWTVPYKATNRLLIGPFKSNESARAMVNKLGKAGIAASTFTSDAGQEINRLGGK